MRVNWFSPLPPARTDIAHYTARTLPALTARVDVTLWTQEAGWDPSLENLAEVRYYDPVTIDWPELADADVTVYHLGNDARFHAGIWQVSQAHPGVVVLHDLRLHQFFESVFHVHLPEGGRDRYAAAMERYYGRAGRREGDEWWDQRLPIEYMVERYPLGELAAHGAIGVVIHNDGMERRAAGAIPLVFAPLPYPASRSPDDVARAIAGRGSDPPVRLIAFGHMGANRRLNAIVQALAELPERHRFRLDVYGQVAAREDLMSHIRLLDLDDIVTVHGFVPEPVLDDALDAAHLAFNLRFPTAGEASGSQLRIWDHALPTLVTPVGWYAGLPEDVVAHVRVKHEIADIHRHLRHLLADPGCFADMGWRGLAILREQHSPEGYVRTLLQLADRSGRLRVSAAALDLGDRVGTEIGGWGARGSIVDAERAAARALVGLFG